MMRPRASARLALLVAPLLLVACGEAVPNHTVVEVELCGELPSRPDALELTIETDGQNETRSYPFETALPTTLTATLPTSITGRVSLTATAGSSTAEGSLVLQPGGQNQVQLCFGGCPCGPRDAGPDVADAADGADADQGGDADQGPDGPTDGGDLGDRGGDADSGFPPTCDPAIPFALPAPIGVLNSVAHEFTPLLAPGGLDLYFASEVSGQGGVDLFVSHRDSESEPFGAAVNLVGVNSSFEDLAPALTADARTLYFASDRDGGFKIYRATRQQAGDPALRPFGTPAVVAELSGSEEASFPWISPDGQRIYYTRYAAYPVGQLYSATLGADGQTFETPAPLAGVGSGDSDSSPSLSADERILYFTSTRTAGTPYPRVHVATRASRDVDFGTPRLVPELFTIDRGLGYAETSVSVTPDACTLFLSSDRGNAARANDQLYVTRRTSCDQSQPFSQVTDANVGFITGYFGTNYNIYVGGISSDGRELYVNTDAAPVTIWVASRPSADAPFDSVVELQSSYPTSGGSLTPDNLTLYYGQDRGSGTRPYRVSRSTLADPFNLDAGENVTELNITGLQSAPSLAPDGQTLYFTGEISSGPVVVAVMFSTWNGTSWSAPQQLPNFPASQGAAALTGFSADQLTGYGSTYGNGYDVVQVTRPTRDSDFGAPQLLPFDDTPTAGLELGAIASPDGCSLFYTASRDGSAYNLLEARRSSVP